MNKGSKPKINLRLKSRIVLRYGTQEDFAIALGIAPSIVSKVVSNRYMIEAATKSIYANRLECKVFEIF